MDQNYIKSLLKSVWTRCAHNGTKCTKLATTQVEFERISKKKVYSQALSIGFDFDQEDNLIEGKYCANCVKEQLPFLKNVHAEDKIVSRQIPGIEEAMELFEMKE
jgi:hypothetical protein